MPTEDSRQIESWDDNQVSRILKNENYKKHFSEMVTRRLRRQIQPYFQTEPGYTHSLDQMEATAFFFLESSLYGKNIEECRALFHEAAIIFEQLSYLYLEQDLKELTTSDLIGQRLIVSALCYYLAGYEANAIVLSKEYLNKEIERETVGIVCAELLSKHLKNLRKILFLELGEIDQSDKLIVGLSAGDITFGDILFIAAKRSFFYGISSFMQWIRTGDNSLVIETKNNLKLSIKGLDDCGRQLDSMTIRLLIRVLDVWFKRSPWNCLNKQLEGNKANTWIKYIRILSSGSIPLTEFWRSQIDLIEPLLNFQAGLVVSMPTSAGKTRIAEIAVVDEMTRSNDKKVIYVAPTRALVAEVEKTFSKCLPFLDYSVSKLYGGYELNDFEEKIIEKNRMLILTPEKLDLLMRQDNKFIDNIGLIIIDEGHQVAQGQRGLRLEFIISRIRFFAAKTLSTRVLFLSAVLPNGDEVAKWIAGDESFSIKNNWKPTRVWQWAFQWGGTYGNSGQLFYLDDSDEPVERFIPGLVDKKEIKHRDEVLTHLAIHFIKIGSVLIFTIKPDRVEKLSKIIIKLLDYKKIESISNNQEKINKNIIPQLSRIIGADHNLISCLRRGFSYHYGPLPREVRNVIEGGVRNETIPLIIANETLAQGINLPIKTLIIDTINRYNELMSVRDFWNVAGRTGRATTEIEGNIIYFPDERWDYPKYLAPYLNKKIEKCESTILQSALNNITPTHIEWSKEWISKFPQDHYEFINPWPIILEISENKVKTLLGKEESGKFGTFMKSALAKQLLPGYSNNDWKIDKWKWNEILTNVLRRGFIEDIDLSELANVDIYLHDRFKDILDSQILAMAAEEIFDPDNHESIDNFIEYTLFKSNELSTKELQSAYGKGLRNRFLKVLDKINDKLKREIFNKTGLSLAGNLYLDERLIEIKEIINQFYSIDIEQLWSTEEKISIDDVITKIIDVVNNIPDLKPGKRRKRETDLILDWLNGKPLIEIAKKHKKNHDEIVQIIESDVVGLIPWGIQALITFLSYGSDFHGNAFTDILKNFPAKISFGVPEIPAVFSLSMGIADRETAIKLGEFYLKQNGNEINYPFFKEWFTDLLTNQKELDEFIKDKEIVKMILQCAKEVERIENKKKYKLIFQIGKEHAELFKNGEEVQLDASRKDNEDHILSVYDYRFYKKLTFQIEENDAHLIKQNEYIATWKKEKGKIELAVEILTGI